jgi:hypothetical protein
MFRRTTGYWQLAQSQETPALATLVDLQSWTWPTWHTTQRFCLSSCQLIIFLQLAQVLDL